MLSFLRHHIIYSVIGFAFVIAAGVGFFVYQKYTAIQSQTNQNQSATNPTPETAELAFSLSNQEEQTQCSSFTASPTQSTAPAAIIFSAQVSGNQGDNLTLDYDFGDEDVQNIDRLITAENGTETQNTSHTYTAAGSYTTTLTITNPASDKDPVVCTASVAVSGALNGDNNRITPPTELPETGLTSTVSPTALKTTPTTVVKVLNPAGTSPTIIALAEISPTAVKPTPTIKPSATKVPTPTARIRVSPTAAIEEDETIPVPKVPEAGGFLPTALAALGGLLLVALVFAL